MRKTSVNAEVVVEEEVATVATEDLVEIAEIAEAVVVVVAEEAARIDLSSTKRPSPLSELIASPAKVNNKSLD